MPADADRLAANLESIRGRIAAACARSGRSESDVRLVAVTKSVGLEEIRRLHALGQRDFGENRVPDGLEKAEALAGEEVRWHFIGHLQRNKAARAVTHFRRIHSVESLKLARILGRCGEEGGFAVEALAEVNVAGEASKYGLAPEETEAFLQNAAAVPALRFTGLMTMAPWVEEAEEVRGVFRRLRELRDRLRDRRGWELPHLSMGMSNDYEVAVEEGATLVRVGSALFA